MRTIKIILMAVIFTLQNNGLYSQERRISVCSNSGNTYFPASEKSYKNQKEDGTLICWLQQSSGGSVYVQKLDLKGKIVWQSNGLMADYHIGGGFIRESDYPLLFSDHNGGAIIIYRKAFNDREEIYLQKIFSNGRVLRNPVCLSSNYGGYNYSPSADVSEENEIIITWENFTDGDFNIHAQKVNFAGTKIWNKGKEAVICNNEFDQRKPIIISGNGCSYISWLDARDDNDNSFDLYANKIDNDGQPTEFGSSGKLIFKNEGVNNMSRKILFYNHYMVNSDENSFITAFEKVISQGRSSIHVMKVNVKLEEEWTLNMDHGVYQKNPLIVTGKYDGAAIFWNESIENTHKIFGVGLNKHGNPVWGSPSGANLSCDLMKNTSERILPDGGNKNGIFTNNNKIFLSWTLKESDNLFLKELNLTDESKQCGNITEIQTGVSEGEYTSITTQLNNLVVVYFQSNNICAYVRKLDDNKQKKGKQRNVISNFPNPFNPSTKISFSIPSDGFVRLSVYDITGRLIKTLVNEFRQAGSYSEIFDGGKVATGVYFYRLETDGDVLTKKMTLIK